MRCIKCRAVEKIKDLHIRRQTQLSLHEIAQLVNPLLRGWIGYYGRYAPAILILIFRVVGGRIDLVAPE